MKDLKALFEKNGFAEVSTYINSGNVLFESHEDTQRIRTTIEALMFREYGQEIKVLVLDKDRIVNIADAIPREWENDAHQKSDVAYLFDAIDSEQILEALPVKKEYIKLIYTRGALLWNVARSDYNKSLLNKIISHRVYKEMTVRNVNTARYLASVM